jgi:hypothetical protein
MSILSRTGGGSRVAQLSLEPLPLHAEQMTGELTKPDPLHAVHVSSFTPSSLHNGAPLLASCQARQ